ncbi:MAG TPA: SRPBCC family protein [Steroidobacteraceae bacterium]|jgi:uncharacterized protein YndB with AHSA1/START domain|nr:SRPBCC family protein [Steroidobacteraceae bacterium]
MPDAVRLASVGSEVRKTLLLNCSQERAFRVFTERMGRWWPATHHVGDVPFKEILIEPRAGGRWYEINAKGAEGLWGHVLGWEPPRRLILSWHLDAKWQFNADLARASEIDVRFESLAPDQTRIDWLHRAIERHGEGYEGLRNLLDQGWVGILAEYAKLAEGEGMNSPATAPTDVSGAA